MPLRKSPTVVHSIKHDRQGIALINVSEVLLSRGRLYLLHFLPNSIFRIINALEGHSVDDLGLAALNRFRMFRSKNVYKIPKYRHFFHCFNLL
ncbi:hypothetical protein CEXT_570561 [Caerostris extrusa]|uniref:Uncharacterized protein n=1 Tax=Caerostris extrusa TaxID=172846 RepID=A0AAV4SZJ3_CAEEX|nr:hypothetical protein CEXT_570561 [Caerostris extrusa]